MRPGGRLRSWRGPGILPLDVPADLDAIPRARLPFTHLCDAPAERPTTLEGLLHNARAERLPSGEGGIEIKRVVDQRPAGIPIALEVVPMTAFTQAAGAEVVERRVIEAARRLLG